MQSGLFMFLSKFLEKTHGGEKPNKCSLCAHASSRASNLTHLKLQIGEKSNNWNQRDYDYASSRADKSRRHLKTHSGHTRNHTMKKDQTNSTRSVIMHHHDLKFSQHSSQTHTGLKSNKEKQYEFSSIIQSWTNALETHMMKM